MKQKTNILVRFKQWILYVVRRSLFFPMYVLMNKDQSKLRVIIALNDKIAIKKAKKELNVIGGDWVFDKIVLVNLIRKKTIIKWD